MRASAPARSNRQAIEWNSAVSAGEIVNHAEGLSMRQRRRDRNYAEQEREGKHKLAEGRGRLRPHETGYPFRVHVWGARKAGSSKKEET
jgi:hypothetical protein